MLLTNQIREKFLAYFKQNGHEILPSSSLIPHNDPTIMFANAGMNQFKNYFTGVEKPIFSRVATSQKCVRAGGKHNDLDNVGFTARHHTFFEMLGNFSFGDYFKEEAIFFAWELLTKEFGIDKNRLFVTIYHNDDEAANIWKKITSFSDDKIIRISTDDNFWSMGETGPCGPCSEIFFDHGEKVAGGIPGSINQDGDRYTEIWNLVFMQFEKQKNGDLISLPKPCIDTGMGLERIASVLQGVNDNYQTDIFKNLITEIENNLGQKFSNN
jgi:alanyl-tRNA synthetase